MQKIVNFFFVNKLIENSNLTVCCRMFVVVANRMETKIKYKPNKLSLAKEKDYFWMFEGRQYTKNWLTHTCIQRKRVTFSTLNGITWATVRLCMRNDAFSCVHQIILQTNTLNSTVVSQRRTVVAIVLCVMCCCMIVYTRTNNFY